MSDVRTIIMIAFALASALAICILLMYGLNNWRRACREMWLVYIGANVLWFAALLWSRENLR